MIKYIDKQTIDSYVFPATEQAENIKKYLLPFFRHESDRLISNMHVEAALLEIENIVIPVFITNKNYRDNYTVSFYSQFIVYPLEELRFLKSGLLRGFSRFMLNILKYFLKSFHINKTVYIYNLGVSTVLHDEKHLKYNIVEEVTHFLTDKFPNYQLAWRSLNDYTEKALFSTLTKTGYKKVLSRKILISRKHDELSASHRKHLNADFRHLTKNKFTIRRTECVTEDEAGKITELYHQLYINKYSSQNPLITPLYLSELKDFYSFHLLYDTDKIIGALAYYHNNRYLTAPLLGYDFSYDKKYGLYRILTSDLYFSVIKTPYILNWSSGVEVFKKNRGAFVVTEYNCVYYNHLNFYRRISWRILCGVVNTIAVKILNNNEV